jgi:hypothetical protein
VLVDGKGRAVAGYSGARAVGFFVGPIVHGVWRSTHLYNWRL